MVSFDSDIKPMFTQYFGEMRWRFDMTRYEDVRTNAELIYSRIRSSNPDGRMPPAPFDPLTMDEVALFKTWIDQGCPP